MKLGPAVCVKAPDEETDGYGVVKEMGVVPVFLWYRGSGSE